MKVPKVAPTPAVVPQPVSSEDVEAVRIEAAQRAREDAQAAIEQRLQQFQVGVEAEKAAWTSSFQRSLNAQIEPFQ
jgi:non-canonical (house-cleaning) NTP pyrophosphatase